MEEEKCVRLLLVARQPSGACQLLGTSLCVKDGGFILVGVIFPPNSDMLESVQCNFD